MGANVIDHLNLQKADRLLKISSLVAWLRAFKIISTYSTNWVTTSHFMCSELWTNIKP